MHYDYTRFDWDDRTWSGIYRLGIIPKRDKPNTVLIGAFLRSMHEFHGRHVVVSNHKRIAVQARVCLQWFEDCPDHFQAGDMPQATALQRALDYIEWFVCDPAAYVANKKTLIKCFSRDFYYWYALAAPVNKERCEHAAADETEELWLP